MKTVQRRGNGVLRTVIFGSALVLLGAGAGFWLAGLLPDGTLISLVKYASVLLGVVWAFSMIVYNKLSDLTDLAGIDYRQHRGLEAAIQLRLQRFWYRATMLGLAGLAANIPMFLKDGGITPQPWVFAVSFGSLALGTFLLRGVWFELEDIRELRSEVKELERLEQRRAEQIQSLKNGNAEDWKDDPRLSGIGRSETGDEQADN